MGLIDRSLSKRKRIAKLSLENSKTVPGLRIIIFIYENSR